MKKDLKKLKLNENDLINLIQQQSIEVETGIKGKTIIGNENISIRKLYVNYNNSGVKRGLRFIVYVAVEDGQIILIHIYNKSSKKDMSHNEYKNLKMLYNDLLTEE